MVKLYLDNDGDLIGGDGLDVEKLLTPDEIEAQETIKQHFGIEDSTTEALKISTLVSIHLFISSLFKFLNKDTSLAPPNSAIIYPMYIFNGTLLIVSL